MYSNADESQIVWLRKMLRAHNLLINNSSTKHFR